MSPADTEAWTEDAFPRRRHFAVCGAERSTPISYVCQQTDNKTRRRDLECLLNHLGSIIRSRSLSVRTANRCRSSLFAFLAAWQARLAISLLVPSDLRIGSYTRCFAACSDMGQHYERRLQFFGAPPRDTMPRSASMDARRLINQAQRSASHSPHRKLGKFG